MLKDYAQVLVDKYNMCDIVFKFWLFQKSKTVKSVESEKMGNRNRNIDISEIQRAFNAIPDVEDAFRRDTERRRRVTQMEMDRNHHKHVMIRRALFYSFFPIVFMILKLKGVI